ncbi:MAG: TAXI family TRAP transporter solute-binding subunit, partial [Mesorhizobium sp.]
SEGSANPDLRMVATMIPFNAGLVVPVSTGVNSLSELKGRTLPRFPPNSLGEFFISASLATVGLSYDDVKGLPTSNFGQQFNNVKERLTELTIGSVGAQSIMDVEASVGEVRYLSFKEGDDAILSKYLPGTSIKAWGDRAPAAGVTPDTMVLYYDYTLFTHKDTPDEVITAVIDALYSNPDAVRTGGALWDEFDPKALARVTELPFHPAAEAYYREKGIWPTN